MKKDFCSPLQCVLLIVIMYSGCSEFNQPVTLDTFFSWRAGDGVSDIWVELSPGGAQLSCDWYDTGSINAKFFLKERKENEFITAPLSSLPVDFRADIHLREINIETNEKFSYVEYFDKNGKEISRSTLDNSTKFMLTFNKFDALSHIQVYFWQFEFYGSGYTVRLPDKPEMWCIQSEVRFVEN